MDSKMAMQIWIQTTELHMQNNALRHLLLVHVRSQWRWSRVGMEITMHQRIRLVHEMIIMEDKYALEKF